MIPSSMQHLWLQGRRCRSFNRPPPRAFPPAARGTRGTRGSIQVQLTDGLDRRPKSWGRSRSWWEPWQNWQIGRNKASKTSKNIKKHQNILYQKRSQDITGKGFVKVWRCTQTQLRANLATNSMHSSFLRPLDPNFFDDMPFRPSLPLTRNSPNLRRNILKARRRNCRKPEAIAVLMQPISSGCGKIGLLTVPCSQKVPLRKRPLWIHLQTQISSTSNTLESKF